MAKRKAKKFTGTQVLVIVVITALVVFFAPKLIHKCDDCGKIFVGDQEIICKECAEKQHAVAGFFGGDIEEYRRGLFD